MITEQSITKNAKQWDSSAQTIKQWDLSTPKPSWNQNYVRNNVPNNEGKRCFVKNLRVNKRKKKRRKKEDEDKKWRPWIFSPPPPPPPPILFALSSLSFISTHLIKSSSAFAYHIPLWTLPQKDHKSCFFLCIVSVYQNTLWYVSRFLACTQNSRLTKMV